MAPQYEPDSRLDLPVGLTYCPADAQGMSLFKVALSVSRKSRALALREKPDIVYLREFPLDWLFMTRRLASARIPYVTEINTMVLHQSRAKGKLLKGLVYTFSERYTLASSLAWLPVTEEIARWARRVAGVSRPYIIAGNGVDPDPVSPVRSREEVRRSHGVDDRTKVLIMAGVCFPWHGADRAVDLLAWLDAKVRLWLVGPAGEAQTREIESVAAARGLAERVRVFPRMPRERVLELAQAADVGLGSLAFDRAAVSQAQPVKTRQYLALGLPVLINFKDPRLADELPFVANVITTDPAVLAEAVKKLLELPESMRGGIREYAARRLSWTTIARETATFLEYVLQPRQRFVCGVIPRGRGDRVVARSPLAKKWHCKSQPDT